MKKYCISYWGKTDDITSIIISAHNEYMARKLYYKLVGDYKIISIKEIY